MDANGRFDTPERLWDFIYFLDKHNILDDVAVLEEPFAEESSFFTGDFPVALCADESAHSVADLKKRFAEGYRAVALKPAAKTLSVSFQMAKAAYEAGGQCLVADLTVNPLLVMWNKQFAARVTPLAALNAGCIEVNGDQNYAFWEEQKRLLPQNIVYTHPYGGYFVCDDAFYGKSASLFEKNGYWDFFTGA